MSPTKTRGRPRKYTSLEEVRKANTANKRRQRLHRTGPADFIAFEPSRLFDIPASTPPEIGLRISPDIRIPLEHNIGELNTQSHLPPSNLHRGPDLPNTAEEDEIASRVKEIQIDEQDGRGEEEDYDAEVAARVKAMTAADYEAAVVLQALQSQRVEEQRSDEANSQQSGYAIQQFDDFDLSVQHESSPSPIPANITSNLQR